MLMNGGYAEKVAVPAAPRWSPIPEEVSDDQAAGVLLQGLTAWTLLRVSGRRRAGRDASSSRPPPAAPARSPCSSPSAMGAGA